MSKKSMPVPDDLLTEQEAAAEMKLSVFTLRNWRALKRPDAPRFIRLGARAIRYRRSDLEAFIASGEAEG